MRVRGRTRWLALVTVPAAVALTATSAAIAATATHASATGGPQHEYIVILRNQNSQLKARSAARRAAVSAEQHPIITELRSIGGKELGSISLINAVFAKTTAAGARALAANPAVAEVVPNQLIPGPTVTQAQPGVAGALGTGGPTATPQLCGTASDPQLNPEALYNINALPAIQAGDDGAGVTVATIADGIDTDNPDFVRNAAFSSASSATGSPVVTEEDFSSDGVNAPTAGGEMYLDTSSIAAQGNTAYDLNSYLAPVHQFSSPCYIKIQGDAPGANVLALKVFAQNNNTTVSAFLQAIDYAASHGVKVINESFGSNNFPDLAQDVTRMADDAAVRAGITVVVSSGDAGSTSTIGSPATDPEVISVGASTTFRSYAQSADGGINVPGADPNLAYVDNNISGLSSGGYSGTGGTVDLVAPGDLNWALCNSDRKLFSDCTNEAETAGADIQDTGGTSEAAPLTSGAAADVIQAFAATHAGTDPSPALVKQILMSTATDVDAPATEQGAGLLNVTAAVNLAQSIGNPTSGGGLLISPNQIDVSQQPGATTTQTISITNESSQSEQVALSTRALTDQVGNSAGSFCIQPGKPSASCPANTGSFPIWSGITEVYQDESFTVPANSGPSRLDFVADYPLDNPEQTSLVHVALFEPDGAFAGYSIPQGLADYARVEVADPPPGQWTAVFFTEQNGATVGGVGTSGKIQWDASTLQYAPAAPISPDTLTLAAGQTGTATVQLTSPADAGDTSQSVVVSWNGGQTTTTIPVVIRTVVPTSSSGGTFSGVLTGGNGRAGSQSQANYYAFNVPRGAKDIHAEVTLDNDPGDLVTAYLVDPSGQTLGYSTNATVNASGTIALSALWVDLYHAHPQPGQWRLELQWNNPVSGLELNEPFSGTITFGALPISATLPHGQALRAGKTYTYHVTVHNSGRAPEAYFVDPRLDRNETISLVNVNGYIDAAKMTLPLPASIKGNLPFPYYVVPTQTSKIHETLTSTVPVDFDSSYFPGDPDLEGVPSGNSASLTYTNAEISPGLWDLNPSEVGPYPTGGGRKAPASASFSALTKAFDPTVTSSTGDLWSFVNHLSKKFAAVWVPGGGTATITVKIKAAGKANTTHSGVLLVDDVTLAGFFSVFDYPNGDELAAFPYSYRIVK